MNVQQGAPRARALRKFVSGWICPRCSLANSKRSASTSSNQISSNVIKTRSEGEPSYLPTQPSETPTSSRRSGSKGPDIVFSLIQPTGIPHLGNYLGAIRRWIDIEEGEQLTKNNGSRELYFGLADLHSLTSKQSSLQRRQNVKETFAALLALGLGTKEGHTADLFVQSQVAAHTEMMWILSTITSTGSLSRMVQWKDKSGISTDITSEKASQHPIKNDSAEKLKLGLFSYPVLQAADILVYHATHVPVGEDQAQHIELTRTLARSFNSAFKRELFQAPKLMVSPARRIMSLQNPTKKMSKSDPDALSRILVTDAPNIIQDKLKKARTDSIEGITYDPENRPGVSNLIDIFKYITKSEASQEAIAKGFANKSMFDFKMLLADEVIREFEGVGEKFDELMKDDDFLKEKMSNGNLRARRRASSTLTSVRETIGLDYPCGRDATRTPSIPQ